MKKNNEIIAIKACGLDLFKVSGIIMMISLLIGITTFLFGEMIVPYTSSKSNEIWNMEVEKYDTRRFYGGDQIWYKAPNAIYWIKHFDSNNNIMENPTFYFFDSTFHLIKRIDAKRGVWNNGKWRIEEGIVQEKIIGHDYQSSKFNELLLEIPETPDTFIKGIKKPEDMSFQQLKKYSEMISQEGYDNTKYRIDMHIKPAQPFFILILTLIGIPVAIRINKGGTPLAVSVGVGICFLYMVFLGFARSFGVSGILPPILSAWIANLIFLFFGIYLMCNIER